MIEKEYNMARNIHQLQEVGGSLQLSAVLADFSDTWVQCHPSWNYKLWSMSDVQHLMRACFPASPFAYCDADDALLADVARYLILYQEGGLYVDRDFECFEAFDSLVENEQLCLIGDPNRFPGQPCSDALLFSTRGHPFLRFLLEQAGKHVEMLRQQGRRAFLNRMLDCYPDKHAVKVLPSEKVNPFTRDEIRLNSYGLLPEGELDERTEAAYCCCYYKKSTGRAFSPVPRDKTDILYVSTKANGVGGAYNAAQRIHLGLRSIGFNSKMLVLQSNMSSEENRQNEIYLAAREPGVPCGHESDMQALRAYPRYHPYSYGFSPDVVGVDIVKNIESFAPRLVILHGINGGFAKVEDLARIRRKVVWRLPDCWTFTGGCFYFGNCKHYLTGCGQCPKLGSDNPDDISHERWLRKREAWSQMDMTVVVPTLWMEKLVKESPLLRDKSVYSIPNGLDLTRHYPVDKQLARKALRIPIDKKVILFGAIFAFDARKGISCLIDALRLLEARHRDEYYFIVFGGGAADLRLGIPVRFLGYLSDPYLLQLAYSAADVMVVPSLEEAFGQTATEAMACATPVISFLETGLASIVRHKRTGYLARFADCVDLAVGIEWVLDDRERLQSLSANARLQVEQEYDANIVAKQYVDLFHKLLDR